MTSALIAELRRKIAAIETSAVAGPEAAAGPALPFAAGDIDRRLGGGLAQGELHEVVAADPRGGAAATGFALALAARLLAGNGRSMLWIQQAMAGQEAGAPYAPGLNLLGLAPERLLMVRARRAHDVLWAAEEGLACPALTLVLAELWDARALSLAASRRLRLTARNSGVTALLLLNAPRPFASSSCTRWRVAPHPSAAAERGVLHGPGPPCWQVALERNRAGATGAWTLEWNPDEHAFRIPPADSCPVAAPSSHRPDRARPARPGNTPARQAG